MTKEDAKKKLPQRVYDHRAKVARQLRRLEPIARPHGDTHRQEKLTQKQYARRQRQVWENLQTEINPEQEAMLKKESWDQDFYSSNVWKFKIKNNNLLVAFLNGSVYIYFGAGKLFLGMHNAGSKGKFVWRQLRRKGIPYDKLV